jgi:predicted enzyme related to lactoylglutathione lyase
MALQPPPQAIPYISHVEWCCIDPDRMAEFLKALFGWEFQPYGRHYRLYAPEDQTQVGLLQVERVEPAAGALAFVAVPDIDATLAQATALGSAIVVAKTGIPDYGWYAQISAPEGQIVGLFETLAEKV